MTTTAAAIYEHGMLRPLVPLPLAEGARVEITVTDDAAPSNAPGVSGASDLLREIAGLPVESGDDGFSARDHDRVLYGDVCEEVKSWEPEKRERLARHLKILQIANDPARMAELTRGNEEIQAGCGVSRDELLAYLRSRDIAPA